MRLWFVILGLLALSAPALAAPVEGCHASLACVTESNDEEGDCDDGFEAHSTEVNVGSGELVVRGAEYCYGFSGYGQYEEALVVSAAGMASAGVVRHGYSDPETGSFDGCFVFVSAGLVGTLQNCPASPPDMPWGEVLP